LILQISNLNFRYTNKDVHGIKDLDFSITDGSINCIIGPSGSGKSTLLKLILNQIKPDSGSILFSGKKMIEFHPEEVITSPLPLDKYLLQNAKVDLTEEKLIQLIRDGADILEMSQSLKRKPQELSQGLYQRFLILKIFINLGDLIILDEPFNHLDDVLKDDIFGVFFNSNTRQGRTIIWCTHDLKRALKYSDQILFLNHGRTEQLGVSSDFIKNPKSPLVAKFLGYDQFFTIKNIGKSFDLSFAKIPFNGIEARDYVLAVNSSDVYFNATPNGKFVISGQIWDGIEQKYKISTENLELTGKSFDELKIGNTVDVNLPAMKVRVIDCL
jgi:ABC-type sugar transport system ATPase subunit